MVVLYLKQRHDDCLTEVLQAPHLCRRYLLLPPLIAPNERTASVVAEERRLFEERKSKRTSFKYDTVDCT